MAHKQKGGGGTRKYGRNIEKCKAYRGRNIRERNKIKRILQSNGYQAAVEYGKRYGVSVPQKAKVK